MEPPCLLASEKKTSSSRSPGSFGSSTRFRAGRTGEQPSEPGERDPRREESVRESKHEARKIRCLESQPLFKTESEVHASLLGVAKDSVYLYIVSSSIHIF